LIAVPLSVPALLRGLVDDAAVFPPGNAPLPEAVRRHREYRAAWYRAMVGPLLVPVSALDRLAPLLEPGESVDVGLIGDTGLDAAVGARDVPTGTGIVVAQVEVPVARRGEDPRPGLDRLAALVAARAPLRTYAEIPLTWGLMDALDEVARLRAGGLDLVPKFRTGGLAAELFPSPAELAAVVCACRDRELPFKLTAGLHRAVRYTDSATGFVHHGFLNVLVAAAAAREGADAPAVADLLASTDPAVVVEAARDRIDTERPLWIGYGSCSIDEPLTDLTRYGLLPTPEAS
jgi:hypothetical protein